MNRITLIHESFICLWGLISGSCSFSFCPELPFLGLVSSVIGLVVVSSVVRKTGVLVARCHVSNSRPFEPFLPCRAESSGDSCMPSPLSSFTFLMLLILAFFGTQWLTWIYPFLTTALVHLWYNLHYLMWIFPGKMEPESFHPVLLSWSVLALLCWVEVLSQNVGWLPLLFPFLFDLTMWFSLITFMQV